MSDYPDYATYVPLRFSYFETVNVSTTETKLEFPKELSSISIVNDGPNTVYIRLNEADAPQIKLLVGDVFSADIFVKRIYHKTETGTSSIRIFGLY